MYDDKKAAAICGLYCGTCPEYDVNCEGCLSDRIAPGCDSCENGFRTCAGEHGVERCYECVEFPCGRLEEFSKKHIVNGICHHEHVIEDLQKMKEAGVESWVRDQEKRHTCKVCGKRIPWYETACPDCGLSGDLDEE